MATFRDLQVGDKIAQFGGSAQVMDITEFKVNGVPLESTKRFTLLEERGVHSTPTPTICVVHLSTEANLIHE